MKDRGCQKPSGGQFLKKHGGADRLAGRDDQRDRVVTRGAVNEGQRAKLTENGVPIRSAEKTKAELVARGERSLATIRTSNR